MLPARPHRHAASDRHRLQLDHRRHRRPKLELPQSHPTDVRGNNLMVHAQCEVVRFHGGRCADIYHTMNGLHANKPAGKYLRPLHPPQPTRPQHRRSRPDQTRTHTTPLVAVSLAFSIRSCSVPNGITATTRPKVSSRATRSRSSCLTGRSVTRSSRSRLPSALSPRSSPIGRPATPQPRALRWTAAPATEATSTTVPSGTGFAIAWLSNPRSRLTVAGPAANRTIATPAT